MIGSHIVDWVAIEGLSKQVELKPGLDKMRDPVMLTWGGNYNNIVERINVAQIK